MFMMFTGVGFFETFYEHQLDPEAIRMAAFVCEDPKDKVAFDAIGIKF